jgi:hypothetical protein
MGRNTNLAEPFIQGLCQVQEIFTFVEKIYIQCIYVYSIYPAELQILLIKA